LTYLQLSYFAAKKGDIARHQGNMKGLYLYIGRILIAGAFTLALGRLLHKRIFG